MLMPHGIHSGNFYNLQLIKVLFKISAIYGANLTRTIVFVVIFVKTPVKTGKPTSPDQPVGFNCYIYIGRYFLKLEVVTGFTSV